MSTLQHQRVVVASVDLTTAIVLQEVIKNPGRQDYIHIECFKNVMFSIQEDVELTKLVERHRCLYDRNHIYYKKYYDIKHKLWVEIAKKCGKDGKCIILFYLCFTYFMYKHNVLWNQYWNIIWKFLNIYLITNY